MTTFHLNHYLDNPLYDDVEFTDDNGRHNIKPSQESVAKIKSNAVLIASTADVENRNVAILTGAGPVWAYLAVQAAIGNYFTEVRYTDGQNNNFKITSKV